jgi:peptide/nickel transport system substrate-binding protein
MTRRPLSRRNLLRAAAMAGLGGAVTACRHERADRQVNAAALGPRKHGGVLRVGVTGGGSFEVLDPHLPATYPMQARVSNLYDPLFRRDAAYHIKSVLAESFEPSERGQVWTLRLRSGVEFHNGKTLDANDVIFTFQRIAGHRFSGPAFTALIDMPGLRRLDPLTLRIPLKQPYALFHEELAQYYAGIVPVGFDVAKPIGTGPFRFGSYLPGQSSSFPIFDNYWGDEQPYVDELVVIDYPDDQRRADALLTGEVQAIDNLRALQVPIVKASGATVLTSETGSWIPFAMRLDVAPFDNVLVRRAFRLIADREELVREALDGQGRVANDLYAPFDPCYAKEFPQRGQDLDQARFLLKKAGHENLQLELVTSGAAGRGVVVAANLFARQAKGAGVDIRVREVDLPAFYGGDYRKRPLTQGYFFTRSYLPQVILGSLPNSALNLSHWNDPLFNSLINKARAELDESKRNELLTEAQRLEYDNGGLLIWGFGNQVDAYAEQVTGFVPDRNLPLSSYQFRDISFVQQP